MLFRSRNDPHGLDAKLPQESASQPPPSRKPDPTIVLQVLQGASGESLLRLNHEEVAWPELAARLREIYKTRATKVMFIHGGKEVEFAYVARAIDAAREADPGISIGLLDREIASD